MMKKKKIGIIIFVVLLIAAIVGTIIYFLNDNQRLNVEERQWINENNANVISINVPNNLNIFGKDGQGVYYDFITDMAEYYNLQINPVIYNEGDQISGLTFGYSLTEENFLNFYKDHFVLVSKNKEIVNDITSLKDNRIGVLSNFKDHVEVNFSYNQDNEFVAYENMEDLLTAFDKNTEITYMILPKYMYLDVLLEKEYHIVYHLSDMNLYYGIATDESPLCTILTKYFNNWKKEQEPVSMNEHEFNLFTTSLNIDSTDIDALRAKSYSYGFVNHAPYEILSGGSFGGINAVYLKKFADLADIKFDFIKFNKIKKLQQAAIDNTIDIYFNYYNLTDRFEEISSNMLVSYVLVAPQNNSIVLHSLTSLNGKTIYVEEQSRIAVMLQQIGGIKLETYKNQKELKKIIKNEGLIAMDPNEYESYKENLLSQYSVRYEESFKDTYRFATSEDETFKKLFSSYLETLDSKELNYIGINNYFVTRKNGSVAGTLAKYTLILLCLLAIIIFLVYKKGKKISLAKRLKKEDKMRFIDQLTSLKNRNYLTENLESWNNNTIYPQAIIVLDLNRVQEINDTLGYEQGDMQIQAAANILVKTQLDKTDIIRTDGNEFLIYLVGYEVKQITSYIHKLNKEFKKLPFDYGAAIGYSMIMDDVKSIEDATNEAIEQIRTQKEEKKDE